ncbi:MAG TPA: leucyl aminopeptidase family protein [Candidatus Competibacteraceae bacterium]|nr:leucyl aminopeptidase family protein [Candidatus Competibacteraceae bacterium]
MRDCLLPHCPPDTVPLRLVHQSDYAAWREAQPAHLQSWLAANRFVATPGAFCPLPGAGGVLEAVLVIHDDEAGPWTLAGLPQALPEGDYRLAEPVAAERAAVYALGWALGAYQYTRYKAAKRAPARLALPGVELASVRRQAEAVALVRDLINTPAEDMMPEQLAATAEALARECGAQLRQWVGDQLLADNFPTIHAVGRASSHAPRLIELRWGDERHPRVTLVGKGVCFDSGGLDLKPASGMRLMKKDMGGAAHALGLARLIMSEGLPLRLRVLVPAVENAVSGNAFRPGDVIRTRQGLTVEIDNTDAEGRLILCDALSEAAAEQPELLVDFATLTGAARVALGPELPALFCNDEGVAAGLAAAAAETQDPLWRLPLHAAYKEYLDSKIADLANSASGPYAGAITAALFLQSFVPAGQPWAHLDIMAWNTRNRPGRPEGGEAMGLRAVYAYLRKRYG